MTYTPPRRSDGTIQVRRVPQPWPKGKPFKILSIDGGGICGILPASVLAELEGRFLNGQSVANYFDMIAGTSTGGIIALALAHGLTATQVRDIYVKNGGKIFPPPSGLARIIRYFRQWHRFLYDKDALQNELLEIFGTTILGSARSRLCIPAFEGKHGEPWIFKTPHHPDYKLDRFERMTTVGLSTSAAPTYFEALPNNGYLMVDGGIWANNPVMTALVDALTCFDIDRGQVKILSLGCAETSYKVDSNLAKGGFIQWRKVIKAAMRAQSLNALGQAYLLIGKNNVTRIDAPEIPNPIEMDNYLRAKAELPPMARSLVEAGGSAVQQTFLSVPADAYVPIPG